MGHCAFIGGGVTEMAFVESGVTAGIPLSAQEGDVFVLVDSASDNFGPVTFGSIAGLTQILATNSDGGGAGQHKITSYWRKIEAGDAGTSYSGQGNVGPVKRFVWALFRPDDEIDSVSISDANSSIKQTPQALTAPASGKPTPVIAFCVAGNPGGTTISSDPVADGSVGILGPASMAWSIFNAAPVDVDYVGNSGNWNTLQSFLLKVE